jgi:multicomponent K+:H+ antiporter subunit A
MQSPAIALMLALPFIGALALLFVSSDRRRLSGWLAGAFTLGGGVLLMWVAGAVFGGEVVRWRVEWLPSLGVNFGLRLDGLALLFSLLILGIGALVVLYGAYYLSPTDSSPRFFSYLLLFMGAMLGVVLADNLILLVVFWELTSLSSFLLIGFWRHREDARQGSRCSRACC